MSVEQIAVNIVTAKKMINRCIDKKQPVCLMGPAGLGKSSIVAEICRERNWKLVDLRLSQMDPSDLRGILFPNKETKTADWFAPSCLPHEKDWKGVILLDEIFSAPQMLQASAYQLVLDRKLGDYVLPDEAVVVAAGNGSSDKGLFFKMLGPLANRFAHIVIKPCFVSWKSWAINNVQEKIVSFLETHQHRFHEFSAQSAENAFPSPRTWAMLSNIIETDDNLDEITLLATSLVGSAAAYDFAAFCELTETLVTADEILSGEKYSLPENRTAVISIHNSLLFKALRLQNSNQLNAQHKKQLMKFFVRVLEEKGEALATAFFHEFAAINKIRGFADPELGEEHAKLWRQFADKVMPIVTESAK